MDSPTVPDSETDLPSTFALLVVSETALTRSAPSTCWSRAPATCNTRRAKKERGHVSPLAPGRDWAGNRVPSRAYALCLKCPLPLRSARARATPTRSPNHRC